MHPDGSRPLGKVAQLGFVTTLMSRLQASGLIRCGTVAIASVAAALALATPAAARGAHSSIVGGAPASIAEYPWMAYVQAQVGPEEIKTCSGTVVAPRVVLTAAHCIKDIETGLVTPASAFLVVTGASSLTGVSEANVSTVTSALVFPFFRNAVVHNDAGLLVLARATTAPAVRVASPADRALLKGGTPVSIAGWGLTTPNGSQHSPDLQAGTMVLKDPAYCRGLVSPYYPFFSVATQVCALPPRGSTSQACQGDSGGPAIASSQGAPVEVGIISLGGEVCSTRDPSVFTRVDRFAYWVSGWVAAIEAGAPPPVARAPKVRVPRMTVRRARRLAARALAGDFDGSFRHGSRKRERCARAGAAKARCRVAWRHGGKYYHGSITVFYLVEHEVAFWDERHAIRVVSERCWFHSGNRRSCNVQTRRRPGTRHRSSPRVRVGVNPGP